MRDSKVHFLLQWIFPKVIPYLWDWVLVLGGVTLPRSGSFLGMSQPRIFCPSLSWMISEFQFHKCHETLKYELEELVQLLFVLEWQQKVWNSVRTRVCILSACWSSISKTIIHICDCFIAPSHSNYMDECRILTTLLRIGFLSPVSESSEYAISQSVFRCGLMVPWSLNQRIYFCQYLIFFCLHKLF